MGLDPSIKSRLTPRLASHFEGDSLFARLGRAVCRAECLPRKELYESWELARRVRRRVRGGRVVDLAAGHGLVAYVLLLLDDTSPEAICVDVRRPASAARLAEVLEGEWPRLAGRVRYLEQPIDSVQVASGDLVVSAHACGALTDRVLSLALAARASVAVLPCCHDATVSDTGGLEGWMDPALAIDATRAARLRQAGYRIWTQAIPAEVTPKNRLLVGVPGSEGSDGGRPNDSGWRALPPVISPRQDESAAPRFPPTPRRFDPSAPSHTPSRAHIDRAH